MNNLTQIKTILTPVRMYSVSDIQKIAVELWKGKNYTTKPDSALPREIKEDVLNETVALLSLQVELLTRLEQLSKTRLSREIVLEWFEGFEKLNVGFKYISFEINEYSYKLTNHGTVGDFLIEIERHNRTSLIILTPTEAFAKKLIE